MTLYDLLGYIKTDGSTIVIAKTKGDDGVTLGSNRLHEEFPEFAWNKEIDYIDVVNEKLIVTLDATNDDVESEVLDYLVKECGYTWEEATVKWDKAKIRKRGKLNGKTVCNDTER